MYYAGILLNVWFTLSITHEIMPAYLCLSLHVDVNKQHTPRDTQTLSQPNPPTAAQPSASSPTLRLQHNPQPAAQPSDCSTTLSQQPNPPTAPTFIGTLADGADVLPASVNEASKGVHVCLAAVAAQGTLGTVVHQPENILEGREY